MSLQGIISITGKPGLYKVISQTKTGLIVESLEDKKRLPVYASDKVSALEDISLYTYDEDVLIYDIYKKLYEKTGGKESVSHKASPDELKNALREVQENFDEERVYNSDLKKFFQWFNTLIRSGVLKEAIEAEEKEAKASKDTKEKTAKEAPKTKKTTKPKAAPKANAKPSAAKGTKKVSAPRKSS
jgi:Mg-chelatase subunit ChlI